MVCNILYWDLVIKLLQFDVAALVHGLVVVLDERTVLLAACRELNFVDVLGSFLNMFSHS